MAHPHRILHRREEAGFVISTISVFCRGCRKEKVFDVPADGYVNWRYDGKNIQVAMPQVTPANRELLISGYCGVCWDKMFSPEEV